MWPADGVEVGVDEATMRARDPLPRCLRRGGLARPNILMFSDWNGIPGPAGEREDELAAWCDAVRRTGGRLAVVEVGAIPRSRRCG